MHHEPLTHQMERSKFALELTYNCLSLPESLKLREAPKLGRPCVCAELDLTLAAVAGLLQRGIK